MGEAKRQREKLRDYLLYMANEWTFAPSAWETELVEELLDQSALLVPRLGEDDIQWMRMPSNECHANVRWYVENDPTRETRSVTGWWIQGLDFVLHSVLGKGDQFMCITPTMAGDKTLRFIPDPKIEWVETGQHYSARRNGRIIGMGIRRFPAFTIAQHEAVRSRLEAGMAPRLAIEFNREELDAIMAKTLTAEEIAFLT